MNVFVPRVHTLLTAAGAAMTKTFNSIHLSMAVDMAGDTFPESVIGAEFLVVRVYLLSSIWTHRWSAFMTPKLWQHFN